MKELLRHHTKLVITANLRLKLWLITLDPRNLMTKALFVLLVSTFTKGDQMVPVLNQLGVHCAVYGNHDFGKNIYGVRIKIF